MKYCIRCLYPDTKPDLWFNEQGLCAACIAFNERAKTDWPARELEFKTLCEELKTKKHTYHCIVPVSGGKDSHYQIIKALEYGLNPLAVTATTDDLSGLGRRNLDNISKLGVDHIELTTNSRVRRKINKYTLQEIGDISWAEHVTIFTIPVRVAIQFGINLILWGENPQHEYGGPLESQKAKKLDQRWLEEFGGLNGLRVADLNDSKIASLKELQLYTYPKLNPSKLSGVFLGQFFPWDGAENAMTAIDHGFKTHFGPVEGTGYDYENLDNIQTGIHDYFKYLKFGFGRCTDIASNHIRRKNITREEAKEIIFMYDGKYPATYLNMPLEDTLDKINVTVKEFIEICNRFANPDLFERRENRPPRALFKGVLADA